MKIIGALVTSLTIAAVVGGASGCTLKMSDESRFSEPIPLGSDVALGVPGSTGAATRAQATGIHIASDPPGGITASPAPWYQFTRNVTDAVDLGTGFVLGAIWLVAHTPPTSVEAHRAVWGPGRGTALDPVVWRLTVTEVGDREYDYELDARPKASASESDYRAILKGHGFGATHPEHRRGNFTIDNDAYRALDPSRASWDSGTVKVTFDGRTFPATIQADVKHSADPDFYDVTVTHQKDGSGALDITAFGDVELVKDGRRENVTLHSRWNTTGAGRADLEISGGSTPSTVKGSECWSTTFARSYYSDNVNYRPTEGNAASCVFASSL